MLLPPDYEARRACRRMAAISRLARSPLLRAASALVLVALILARPARVDASFTALLTQTVQYVNILIDEWEKHSRILEDHLDRVTGVMQPFSDLHAGVRELTNTSRLRGVLNLARGYRAALTDPDCYRSYPVPPDCGLLYDFEPPELRSTYYNGRYTIVNGRYTAQQLEDAVYDPDYFDLGTRLYSFVNPSLAAEILRTRIRIEGNINRTRWNLRRGRALTHRARYLSSDFLYMGERGADDCPVDPITDADGNMASGDVTFMDQIAAADCLSARANVHTPLAEGAHLSQAEAATIQTGAMLGQADLAAVQLEADTEADRRRLLAAERAEARRREQLRRRETRLGCLQADDPTLLYAESGGGCGVRADVAARAAAQAAVSDESVLR